MVLEHSKIVKDITETSVLKLMLLTNYSDSDTTRYVGKVKYDTDTYNQSLEEAIETKIYTLILGQMKTNLIN